VRRALIPLTVALALAQARPAAAQPTGSGAQELARARAEFDRGEYRRVLEVLAPQLYPEPKIKDENQLAQAHYLMGASYFYLDQRDKARQEFVALLYIDPDRELDPVVESPEVYGFFVGLKQELRTQLDALREMKRRTEEARRQPSREIVIERTIYARQPWLNWVPFGVGQFQNREMLKGSLFLVSEASLGLACTGLVITQIASYGLPMQIPRDEIRSAQAMQTWQFITCGAFAVVYLGGVLDASLHQAPRAVEKRSERVLGERVHVFPYAGAGEIGLGALLEF
jgi:tetratricopeptide (TPR) repeat protein